MAKIDELKEHLKILRFWLGIDIAVLLAWLVYYQLLKYYQTYADRWCNLILYFCCSCYFYQQDNG